MKNNWIDHPVFLLGNHVDLLPLEKSHLAELFLAASDKELWNLIRIHPTNPVPGLS